MVPKRAPFFYGATIPWYGSINVWLHGIVTSLISPPVSFVYGNAGLSRLVAERLVPIVCDENEIFARGNKK
ncbi:hypothetical protein Pla52o_42870 [Novipirellula galeiformis]|uniref:Uncharacterized protein n=1 Tax=Novipirellula galeiformis TaxID=2528004 RepID=A0A5C6C8C9_9BACT|nr:hypothetical protein Pla52o_42870 [Novipirellula galeiformis]